MQKALLDLTTECLFTVDEIQNACEEVYGSKHVKDIKSVGILPPYEPSSADTDEDLDLSDAEVKGLPVHLPGRILRSTTAVEFKAPDELLEFDSILEEIEKSQTSTNRTANRAKKALENTIRNLTCQILLAGDFNATYPEWGAETPDTEGG
ncbi:unnamed protein product [Brassicogethes aeneus]|uniref:Endonuclease/exonuclease/phosphatase domain-containing protein n=1 Tax=Brassicogethes aeneus TaxID=1431903 RepID=A0A9P0ARM1_BRAAE|nr:unnamed protein product [Brassicogethes aeneus]